MMRAWVVRAGREGEREQAALDEGLLLVGWTELGDLTSAESREDVRSRVVEGYPEEGAAVVANWTGQLYRFRWEIQIGDLVVLPLRSLQLAIGRVTGDYQYRPQAAEDQRHVRAVEWLVKDVARDCLRQDLLDSLGSLLTVFELSRYNHAERVAAVVAHGSDPGRPDQDAFAAGLTSPGKLSDAVKERTSGDPLTISIRDFLAIWNATRRYSAEVDRIEQDLALRGLTTSPPFTEGSLDSTIAVLPLGEEPDESHTSGITRSGIAVAEEPEPQSVAYLVSNLEAANRPPVSVRVDDSLEAARTLMVKHAYSQLPVLDAEDRLRGVVSWESIGSAGMNTRLVTSEPKLVDAIVRAREADRSDDLLDWLPEIYKVGYVIVRDQDHRVCGLITAADLTVQFGTRVRPFVLIEEIEQRLRRVVDSRLPLETIRKVVRSRPESVMSAADLTFGAYGHLLKDDENWQQIGWRADRNLLLGWLEECRVFRNGLMHFSPDPLTDDQLAPVEGLLQLLRRMDPDT
ncbi:CBS domain-containing protein [Embleya scabrispora]|nr:CBS domain-containing protein [Embleya scabrispora]